MPYRTKPHNTYVHGDWIALCDVCGFRFHASDMKKRWDGLYVCHDDWEARHPSDFQKGFPDDQSVPWTRPDTDEDSSSPPVVGVDFLVDTTTSDGLIDSDTGDSLIDS